MLHSLQNGHQAGLERTPVGDGHRGPPSHDLPARRKIDITICGFCALVVQAGCIRSKRVGSSPQPYQTNLAATGTLQTSPSLLEGPFAGNCVTVNEFVVLTEIVADVFGGGFLRGVQCLMRVGEKDALARHDVEGIDHETALDRRAGFAAADSAATVEIDEYLDDLRAPQRGKDIAVIGDGIRGKGRCRI